ncbi:MAG TPA: VCBS domain-containing protein [Tepidisphaeraceae bacterium]|nr:VCBS domain-containing protein [Tepidisphaeraceae bacterium]
MTITLDNPAAGTLVGSFKAVTGVGGKYTFTGTPAAVSAAIDAEMFKTSANEVRPGATVTTHFTVGVSDGFVSSPVTNSATTVAVTSKNDLPTIAGAKAGQKVNDNATILPFTAVTIGDVDPGQTYTVTVTVPTANGTFTPASLIAAGFDGGVASGANTVYTLTGSASTVAATAAIRQLVFKPTAHQVTAKSTVSTTFAIGVNDGFATVTHNVTTVITTAINDAPTGLNATIASGLKATVAVGAAVLTLSAVDPDFGDTFVYSLATGTGGADNAKFKIVGNTLTAAGSLTARAYQVNLKVTDKGGLGFARAFTITIGASSSSVM